MSQNEAAKEEQVIELLKEWDRFYAEGCPVVTDEHYDSLKLESQKRWPKNEYFRGQGAPVTVKGRKVKLPYPLGSLNQRYPDDIEAWVEKYNLKDKAIVLTDKLDGISCLLVYKYGKLDQAFTRGDGYEGQDILRHVEHVASVPLTVDSNVELLAVRAELIMKKATFIGRHLGQYKTARNMVAGVFNRTEPQIDELRDVDLVAYEIIDYKGEGIVWPQSKADYIQHLYDLGFNVPPSFETTYIRLNDESLVSYIQQVKQLSAYDLDGVVITVDDWFNVETQSTSSSLNPEHSVKYKLVASDYITTVVAILWDPSKGAIWKPRIQIEPIEIDGVTITYVTGINARFIRDSGLGKGAVIAVRRDGDVIPGVARVITPVEPDLPEGTEGIDWEWSQNDKGEQVEIVLLDSKNPKVIFKQVLSFFTSLEVDNLKEGSLRTLFDRYELDGTGYTSILHLICDLSVIELEQAIGANGKKIYNSLHKKLETMNMPLLLGSLNYMGAGFGVRKAKALFEQVDYTELWNMTVEQIATLHGFDVKTATNIVKGLPQFSEFLVQFKDYVKFAQPVEPVGEALTGCIVVFTGFRDKTLQTAIEGLGGKVGSSVSGKTTHLLASGKSISEGSSKMDKAREKGVKVMTPDQFKEAFGL